MRKAALKPIIQKIPVLAVGLLSLSILALCYQIRLTRIIPTEHSTPTLIQSIKMMNERTVCGDAQIQTITPEHIEESPVFRIPSDPLSLDLQSQFTPALLLQRLLAYSSYLRPPPTCV
jgi:hypothetical protein